MTETSTAGDARRGSRWRIAAWSIGTAFVLAPLLAMQVTDQVAWSAGDFVLAAALVGGLGLGFELVARRTGSRAYRAAIGVALAATFLLVWVNGAVGVLGSEDNPANLMYGGVLAVGIIGAITAQLRPHRMARALVATATAQTLVALIALLGLSGSTEHIRPEDVLLGTGFFAMLWLTSAWLFHKAAGEREPADSTP